MMAAGVPLVELSGFGVPSRVFAKDETRNRAGSHKWRAASAVSRAAAADRYSCVTVGSCGKYGLAIALAARELGLDATIVVPSAASAVASEIERAGGTVELVSGTYEDAVGVSKRLCAGRRLADGNVDGPYADQIIDALAKIALELASSLNAAPGAVWLPLGDGTTAVALARAFSELDWATPVIGVTSAGNNSILASWPERRHVSIQRESVTLTSAREPLVNWCSLYGQEALDALHLTGGRVVGVADSELVGAQTALGQHGLYASPAGAAGVAGLMRYKVLYGTDVVHVAILTGQ